LTAYEESQKELMTICIDRVSGKTLWSAVAPAVQIEEVHKVSSPANATPVADDERVYVYFGSFGLLCYDHSGNVVWQHALPMPQGFFGTGTSPILVDDVLVLNHDLINRRDAGDSYLLALNRETGKEVWKTKHDSTFTPYSTPVYWRDGTTRQIILFSSGRLASYNANDGIELWSIADLPPEAIATPVVGDGFLFLCGTGYFGEADNAVPQAPYADMLQANDTDHDGLLAISEIPDGLLVIDRKMSRSAGNSSVREVIGYADRDQNLKIDQHEWDVFVKDRESLNQFKQGVYAISLNADEQQPRVAWSDAAGVPEIPSPLYVDGRLYLIKNGGIFYCRDARTGKIIYRRRLRATGGYFASPTCGDGKIYVASDRGVVTVLAAGDKFNTLATNDLGEPITATPAITDKAIYIRTDSHLTAFGNRHHE
jgi:outer membrane protein assembly factor BamB